MSKCDIKETYFIIIYLYKLELILFWNNFKTMKSILKLSLILIINLVYLHASASHFMGGNITYNNVGNNTFAFKTELYRDCDGITLPTQINLYINSISCNIMDTITLELLPNGNNPSVVTPLCPGEIDLCNDPTGLYGVQKYTYIQLGGVNSTAPYTLPANCSDWIISFSSCCRNGVINTGSANDNFYIETTIDNILYSDNNSPIFGFDPIFFGCVGDTVVYGHGVSDLDNDSLAFSLIDCLENMNQPVAYNPSYSGMNPLSNNYIHVDNETGTLKILPTLAQVGVICMKVEEFRGGIKIGEVMRDIQINIRNCSNSSPSLSGINGTTSNKIDVWANQNSTFTIDAFDADVGQNLTIDHSFSLAGATYNTINNNGTTQVIINWTPTLLDIGLNYLNLSVKDDACPVVGKANYSFIINVKGPENTSLKGRIWRADSSFLSFSWIHLLDSNLTKIDSTQTDLLGRYELSNVDTGSYYYLKAIPSFAHNDQVITYYNIVETIQAADSIPIVDGANNIGFTTIDTASATGGKNINGVLYLGVENDPVPLSNIRLILKNSNGDFINDAVTNNAGEFNFYGLDNSIYYVWVDKSGINNSIAPIALASDLSSDTLYFELFDNRLEALVNNTTMVISEKDISIYPNPVATELIIEYNLEKTIKVNISIIDIQGKLIKTLQNQHQNQGKYQIIEKVNKKILPNGIYFIRLQFDNQIVTKQMIIQTK